jgi:hypothetical protein
MNKTICFFTALLLLSAAALAKSGTAWRTPEEIAAVRERCRTEENAIALREKAEAAAAKWLAMDDEALWRFVPDADLPRALNVRFGAGCPVHGEAVFRKGGHYPWLMDPEKPFKVKCPVGGEVYPSNDFAAYLESGRKEKLDTTAPYVDDGNGWLDAEGNRYWFVAHYVFWQRWRKDVFGALGALSHAYELTGDPVYAHKTGVLLGRLTEVYPKMDYAAQAYHNGKWPADIDGRILDYIWENSTIQNIALAYDRVYDGLAGDAALARFLEDKGIADLRRTFEQEVLHFMARDVMEGRIRGNMYYQPTLATLAIITDNDDPEYGPTTEEVVDWLLYGGGEIEMILYNGFDRNGAGGESAPGYSASWNANFAKVADLLARLGHDLASEPRWRNIIHFPYNVTLAGKHSPRIGDCPGDIHAAPALLNDTVLSFGYRHFADPACAQLLLDRNVFGYSLWGDTLDRAEVAAAAGGPACVDLRTRNLGGYGLAVFDSGEGDTRRCATLYYGSPDAWHGHHDRLTIDYWIHGRSFLPEMGYPAHWNDKGERFTRGMPSHYIVEMGEKRSRNKKSGYLDCFSAGEKVRLCRAHADAVYPGIAEEYERTFAMIDLAETSFLVDLFAVEGKAPHDYIFHGLPFGKFSTFGLRRVSHQPEGTLLGEDIPWGGDTSPDASGYDFLRNVYRLTADDVWSVRWVGRDGCRLRYWLPACDEVMICDGEPPFKPDYPESMEFVVARKAGGSSRFPAVIAPSRGADPVRDVTFVPGEGSTGYRVLTEEGEWNIEIAEEGGFSAACQYSGGGWYGFFANHMRAETPAGVFRVEQLPEFRVRAVDYHTGVVRVKGRIRAPEKLAGEVAVVSGNGHSASYTIAAADERSITLEGPLITGLCEISESAKQAVVTPTPFSGFGSQLGARDLRGQCLINEKQTAAGVIENISGTPEGNRVKFAGKVSFEDTGGDGRRLAYFADFKRGYTLSIAPRIEVWADGRGKVSVKSNVPLCEKRVQ